MALLMTVVHIQNVIFGFILFLFEHFSDRQTWSTVSITKLVFHIRACSFYGQQYQLPEVTSKEGEVIALRNLRHASCLRKVSRIGK